MDTTVKTMDTTEKAAVMCAKATVKAAELTDRAANTVGRALQKKWGKILLVLPLAMMSVGATVFAAQSGGGNKGSSSADGFISEIVGQLQTWIPRLGSMIIVVGGIQLGIGFKDDDSTGKTRGMQTMIGGAIVTGIGGLVDFSGGGSGS